MHLLAMSQKRSADSCVVRCLILLQTKIPLHAAIKIDAITHAKAAAIGPIIGSNQMLMATIIINMPAFISQLIRTTPKLYPTRKKGVAST